MVFCRMFVVCFMVCFLFLAPVHGDETPLTPDIDTELADKSRESALEMLGSVVELQNKIHERIAEKRARLSKSSSETEKTKLKSEIERLDQQLDEIKGDFERIATGIDTGLFGKKETEPFDWKSEVLSLVKPGIKEIKRLTSKAREKTKLKEEIEKYETLLPVANQAVEHIAALAERTDNTRLKNRLKMLLPEWKGVQGQMESNHKIAGMQLEKMEQGEKSLVESSRETIKAFFKTRGLFLFLAVMACLAVGFFMRLIYRLVMKAAPQGKGKTRPFYFRAMDLGFRIAALILCLLTIVLVFYMAEDWVLLSLTILFIIGVVWAVKHTLPKMWEQSRLMLNIGAVREGERMIYHGVPWLVKQINFFCLLENPALGVTLRLPIDHMLDKVSRPLKKHEIWFPCQQNDWVILSDGTRGKVTYLSHEMVEMIQRGGACKTYQTQDFLGCAPLNISRQFRLKSLFGINYDHQKISTRMVPEKLELFIQNKVEQEGYKKSLLNLRVEFNSADDSALVLVVIADFSGEVAHLYGRLTRAVQRWCVEACTENNWDIPFPQITVHAYQEPGQEPGSVH